MVAVNRSILHEHDGQTHRPPTGTSSMICLAVSTEYRHVTDTWWMDRHLVTAQFTLSRASHGKTLNGTDKWNERRANDNVPPNHWFWSSVRSRRLSLCPRLCDRETSNKCSKLNRRWQGSWPAGVHLQPIHITSTSSIPIPLHHSQTTNG